jgi:hypothetical protein
LAGKAATNNIGSNSSCVEGSHIVVNRDIWPVLSQHSLAVGIGFAEGDGSHSGSLKTKAKSSDAAEQI